MKTKTAKFGPYVLLGGIFLILAALNIFRHDQWLDSDMAAEMIFSRLLGESGHIFATADWYYSTEFRFLYTQLVMAPLFFLTDNWHIIRGITNVVFYILMLAAYFYMMKPLGIKREVTILTGSVLLLPFSETMMTHMQMGNTYMSHVILLYFYFGIYLRLAGQGARSRRGRRILAGVYAALGVICGVSGVRYLLAMQCPLVLTAMIYLASSTEFQTFRKQFGADKETKKRFMQIGKSERAPYFFYGILGAACSLAGYGVNVLWVSRHYVFQTYGATNFIAVYQGVLGERVQNALGSLLMLFGYIPDKGFLSLRGVVTMLSFVMAGLFVYCVVRGLKRDRGRRYFVSLFLTVSFAVNVFVFCFTTSTMVPRYYITLLMFALPVLAFYLEGDDPVFDRMTVGLLLGFCLCAASVKVTASYLTVDKNADRRGAAAFLEENGYNFGFATYWNANIITELTDGRVEVANLWEPAGGEYFKWSSPMKYYEEDYGSGEIFLLLTGEEEALCRETGVLRGGEAVYDDGKYMVYVFADRETWRSYCS